MDDILSKLEHAEVEEQERVYLHLRKQLFGNSQWRGHPLRIRAMFEKKYVQHIPASAVIDKRIVDFGCGTDNPLHFAVLFFINGAAAVTAFDLKMPADKKRFAFRLGHLIDVIRCVPEDYVFWENSKEQLLERLSMINRAALDEDDWRGAIRDVPIRYVVKDARPYVESLGVVDLCVSYTVLEHVVPFEEHMRHLVAALSHGGLMCHFVDFGDHDRKRIKDPTGPWNMFLTRGTRGGRISNKIRFSEMMDILIELGLTPVTVKRGIASLPAGLREMLLEEYRGMSDEDLKTTSAILVLQK